ncbi:deazaflavin-dependent oxidoreductase, nitroreductase family [Pseudonocardia thermophila]|uniref:Deazaflavin-dependent oxidoreductase, nitroreductase family n=1 Tax=Pseudonocardia thermophila TaxID=1848 RepID=A0A1M6RQS2_PSETH|nr:nitroreductase family deazaflavin-dependent oxidoreductase [Pseudonocardia thermophila]SHK34688.1 deazaflavin-dependent oxidoreductase, nitroreductase family [Pseudonocardia thermophila]
MPLTGEYDQGTHAPWAQEQIEKILATGTTEGLHVKDRPIVLVTYRGRKSGKLRRLPLMRVEHDGVYAAVASKGGAPEHPGWYSSLRDEPLVMLQDGTVTKDYRAREVSGAERDLWWERAVAAYPDYAEYQKKTYRKIPVFVLEPVD